MCLQLVRAIHFNYTQQEQWRVRRMQTMQLRR